jgi:hypothetical protein
MSSTAIVGHPATMPSRRNEKHGFWVESALVKLEWESTRIKIVSPSRWVNETLLALGALAQSTPFHEGFFSAARSITTQSCMHGMLNIYDNTFALCRDRSYLYECSPASKIHSIRLGIFRARLVDP